MLVLLRTFNGDLNSLLLAHSLRNDTEALSSLIHVYASTAHDYFPASSSLVGLVITSTVVCIPCDNGL